MYGLSGNLRKGNEQRQQQEDEYSKMKPKKLCERDPIYVLKKTYTARCGFLCGTLLMCAALAVLDRSRIIDSCVDNRRGISIQGKTGPFQETFFCNRTDIDTDVCLLRGKVHVVTGNSSGVVLHSRICEHLNMSSRSQTIKPYPRKRDPDSVMMQIRSIPLHCVDDSREKSLTPKDRDPDGKNMCNETYSVPAILFSSGGFTRNFFHSFQDVLIPLFILSHHLKGEVVLVTSDVRPTTPTWIERWSNVLRQLSRYPIINLNEESGQHCFPEVVAGTYIHKQLGVEPSLMPNNETMEDFQLLLYEALASPELKQSIIRGGYSNALQTDRNFSPMQLQTRQPKLLIIDRTHTRVLLNQDEVVELARDLKFDVNVASLSNDMDLQAIYGMVHTSDVVMGVHGAGLTNMLFMRRNAVLVQIVPIGTDWPSNNFYGWPAASEFGLNYIEYKIKPEESSLSEKYGLEHPIVQDPLSYISKGWEFEYRLYLQEQSVRPSLSSLRKTLMAARSAALRAFS